MTGSRETDLCAVKLVRRLLESGTEFYSVLEDEGLDIYGSDLPDNPNATPHGQLKIWWGVEIEARSWGIKEIVPYVKRLVLEGWYEDADEDERFYYEYPEEEFQNVGPDLEAPTPENIMWLVRPKWTVNWGLDPYRDRPSLGIWPEAEVNLRNRTIEIMF